MKTGEFIQTQYTREIARIKSELVVAEKQILEEKEIRSLQEKLKLHQYTFAGSMYIGFNCSGGIELGVAKNSYDWILALRCREGAVEVSPILEKELQQFHLRELKTIHPKRAGELLRGLAKQQMLVETPAPATRKWWEFWK